MHECVSAFHGSPKPSWSTLHQEALFVVGRLAATPTSTATVGAEVQTAAFSLHTSRKHRLTAFCASRVAEHPIHGHPYVCSFNVSFYTHAGYSADVATKLQADSEALAAAGERHQKIARASTDDAFYMVNEPGDVCHRNSEQNTVHSLTIRVARQDKYDVADGSAGVCTDVQYAAHAHCAFSYPVPQCCQCAWQYSVW